MPSAITIFRNTEFDAEKAERICQLFAEGFENEDGTIKRMNMSEVCREVGITLRTLRVWFAQWPDFYKQYTVARELYADRLVEEAIRVATEDDKDFYEHTGPSITSMKPNATAVNRAKLRVETLMKVASKLNPERYGDSLRVSSTSTVVHVDETTEAKVKRIENILKAAKEQGYDTKEIRARFEVILAGEEEDSGAKAAQKMLDGPRTLIIPKYQHAEVQKQVG